MPVVERLHNEQVCCHLEGLCSLSAGRTLGYSPFIYIRNFTIKELSNASFATVRVFATACIMKWSKLEVQATWCCLVRKSYCDGGIHLPKAWRVWCRCMFFVDKCEVNISINCWSVTGMYNKDIVQVVWCCVNCPSQFILSAWLHINSVYYLR